MNEMICASCASIPFDPRGPPFGLISESNPFKAANIRKFGTIEHLMRSRCSFCRIIYSAAVTCRRQEPTLSDRNPDQEVGIVWNDDAGPGGGFRLWFATKGTSAGTTLAIVHDPGLPLSNARFIYPHWDNELDYQRLRGWISFCDSNHRGSCYRLPNSDLPLSDHYRGLRTLRFIDVISSCVIETSELCKYFALSYVWGGVASVQLSTANRKQLFKPGSLEKSWNLLPRTIQDAITLTKKLGARYLWVDSLCLVQNKPDDIQTGTQVMDRIYERSALTIVAAYGKDANAGLPGVTPGSRFIMQHIENTPFNLQFGIYVSLEYRLRSTVYRSRAWTFQEEGLSPRALYFVDDRVFFRCGYSIFSEDCVDDVSSHATLKESHHEVISSILLSGDMSSFTKMISLYTSRQLTHQSDIYNALAGVIRRQSTIMHCRFFQGLPTTNFDKYLMFWGKDTSLRRRKGYPSYSWTGWLGSIKQAMERSNIYSRLRDDSWVIWYSATTRSPPRKLYDPFEGSTLRQPDYADSLGVNFDIRETRPSFFDFPPREVPEYQMLQFWTISIFLRISRIDSLRALAYLCGGDEQFCGILYTDSLEDSTFFDANTLLEFVLLSYSSRYTYSASEFTTMDRDEGRLQWEPDETFFGMCIEWVNGIAERRGVGFIQQRAIRQSFDPGPSWGEIMLA